MRTSRLLAAALGTLLAATTTMGAMGAVAVAGDNDREDWSGQRALRMPEGETRAVVLLTNQSQQSDWALLARQTSDPGATPDTWRLREYTRTNGAGLGWRNPVRAPRQVSWFRSAQDRWGRTAAAWIHDGALWAGTKVTGSRAPMAVTRLADEVPGAAAPAVLMAANADGFMIEYAGVRHEFVPGNLNSCNGCDFPSERWRHSAAPSAPAGAPADYARVLRGSGWSMAFWTGDTRVPGDRALRYAERVATPDGPVWSEPRVIADGHQFVDFTLTALGYRLVTRGPDGKVNLFDYDEGLYGTPGALVKRRIVSNPTADGSVQVLVDRQRGLTLTWRDASPEGGLFVWQENRPNSRYLESPTLVPGTAHTETAAVATAPYGTLTVVFQPDRHRRSVQSPRAVHLPAGARKWTDPIRLESPQPAPSRGAYSVGQPRLNGDVWVAAIDDAGVWVHQFDAPKPATEITRPSDTTQRDRTYTVAWKTSWANAIDSEVRARKNKNSRWEDVAVPKATLSTTVTRPRGETRCYQARAILPGGERTDWSKTLCVTVSR